MKKMMAGIFLLLLSIWALVFAVYSSRTMFEHLALTLPFAAAVMFIWGYLEHRD